MARWLKFQSARTAAPAVLALLAIVDARAALDLPAGTELEVRLKTKISSTASHAGDAVEAVLIAPVMVGAEFALPAGATLRGSVVKAVAAAKTDERSVLLLRFQEIEAGGVKHKIEARAAAVENARESVAEDGAIQGILASETIIGRLDRGIGRVGERYAGFADILEAAKNAVFKPAESAIDYGPGVELTLRLTAPLQLGAAAGPGPAFDLRPFAGEAALVKLVSAEPFQTVAQNPPKPSDFTNLLLAGSEEQIRKAFAAAGWSLAAGLNAEAKLETIRAVAENRGYNEAPVSVLLLDGKPPDLVFEKMNNTFARRHHLRVWRRPSTLEGHPVWAVAATHDTGISFSEQNRTFIHKIDPAIDRERAKVVNDLVFTGMIGSLALVDRPKVPTSGQNATGDNIETDGKIAVLELK